VVNLREFNAQVLLNLVGVLTVVMLIIITILVGLAKLVMHQLIKAEQVKEYYFEQHFQIY